MSLVDNILLGGCAVAVDSIHGERIQVLTGPDAGKYFRIMQRETEQDAIFEGEFTTDPRPKRIIRFMDGLAIPQLATNDRIKTEDGKVWNAIMNPLNGYLSTDFEIIQVIAKDA